MRVYNGFSDFPRAAGPAVGTIGNFDGVHLGHRRILRGVVEAARRRGCDSLLVTFDPHPLTVVDPERRPALLTTRGQKLELLESLGLGALIVLPFDAGLAELSGERFFERLRRGGLRLAELLVGENFRFGRDRHGDLPLLERIGREHGFSVTVVPAEHVAGRAVSSSEIRRLVGDGQVDPARRMLGRPYELRGEVVRGDGRGHGLRCPTANMAVENELVPARGVYITETTALGVRHPSVTNIGVRPTFGGERAVVETHLLDFEGDLYRERIAVRFLGRLRDEQKFPGVKELGDQIARDIAAAVAFFHNQPLRSR